MLSNYLSWFPFGDLEVHVQSLIKIQSFHGLVFVGNCNNYLKGQFSAIYTTANRRRKFIILYLPKVFEK